MQFRPLLASIILLMLCSAVSAETYQIRVTWPVRLRASYSLSSPIVGRALAGDVLQVVGSFNRWLKIERNGATAWLADWVDYTRLDQAPAGAGSASAGTQPDIDNCCFVNRLCQTDQEWVDGYWAYQRNECPAPSQSGTSSAPIGGHAVSIKGSPLFVGYIAEVLEYLRQRSQIWYDYVINGADLIREDPNSHAMAALSSQRTILVAPYGRLITVFNREVNVVRAMSGLVHEACHIHRYEAGFPYNGYTKVEEELACIAQETVALRDAVPPRLQGEHGSLGVQHCKGDLTNHPRCETFKGLVARYYGQG